MISQSTQSQMLRYVFAGLSASLISIGLARFAYTPLLPELINQHWFSTADAAYLGAANLAGYLVGALCGRTLGKRFSNKQTLRAMMLAVTLSFFACAFPLSVSWYFIWRFISGVSGGVIMVLVAATVLPSLPEHRRNLGSGAIFLGIGMGIFASATLVPLLINEGLATTWQGLGIASALFTLLSWWNLPQVQPEQKTQPNAPHLSQCSLEIKRQLNILYSQYALMAISIVAPAMFLVDFIARGMQFGTQTGALFWGLYGIGSMVGPVLYGYLADKFGGNRTLRGVLAVEMTALFALAITENYLLMIGLTLIIGTFPPGIVPLMLARINETLHEAHQQNISWSKATVFFASFQALSGYALSTIFNLTQGNHQILFIIGATAFAIALWLGEMGHRNRGL